MKTEPEAHWIKNLRNQVETLNVTDTEIWSLVQVHLNLDEARMLLAALDLVRDRIKPSHGFRDANQEIVDLIYGLATGRMEG